MAVYDFKCHECEKVFEDVTLSMMHEDHEHPVCCGKETQHYFTTCPEMGMRDYELEDGGFIAHGIKGRPVVTSLKQNRELMKRHNLLDANEVYGKPPSKKEQMEQHMDTQASIAAITPDEKQVKQMEADGII